MSYKYNVIFCCYLYFYYIMLYIYYLYLNGGGARHPSRATGKVVPPNYIEKEPPIMHMTFIAAKQSIWRNHTYNTYIYTNLYYRHGRFTFKLKPNPPPDDLARLRMYENIFYYHTALVSQARVA